MFEATLRVTSNKCLFFASRIRKWGLGVHDSPELQLNRAQNVFSLPLQHLQQASLSPDCWGDKDL